MTTTSDEPPISPFRLRIGIFMLFLWWIPFWAALPALAALLGITSEEGKSKLLVFILAIQTIVGFLGLFMAGKQVVSIVKSTPRKKTPGKVAHIIWYGRVD